MKRTYKPKTYAEIISTIWEIQESLGISDYKLSRLAGLSNSTIGKWKLGDRLPHFYQIYKIMEAMGIELTLTVRRTTK